MFKKIYVCCPGGAVSGGPELLHQLVDAFRCYGLDAYILYTPFDKKFSVDISYKHYNTPIARYQEISFSNSLVILPEVSTNLVFEFNDAHIVIWWLSVDNYFSHSGVCSFKCYLHHYLRVIFRRKPSFNKLKSYTHLSQSEYARIFLEKKGLHSSMLTDYLNVTHLVEMNDLKINGRENVVVFNPKKGIKFTEYLIHKNPNVKFVPIQGMTSNQVKELLSRAKVYIDFGHHPGKDRFPREAVMAGCCIITGMRGSAANDIDVPIPKEYKLNELSEDFNDNFKEIVDNIFNDFANCSAQFDRYRAQIKLEPVIFKEQVSKFISNLI